MDVAEIPEDVMRAVTDGQPSTLVAVKALRARYPHFGAKDVPALVRRCWKTLDRRFGLYCLISHGGEIASSNHVGLDAATAAAGPDQEPILIMSVSPEPPEEAAARFLEHGPEVADQLLQLKLAQQMPGSNTAQVRRRFLAEGHGVLRQRARNAAS
jgi:hypothetical protein